MFETLVLVHCGGVYSLIWLIVDVLEQKTMRKTHVQLYAADESSSSRKTHLFEILVLTYRGLAISEYSVCRTYFFLLLMGREAREGYGVEVKQRVT